MRHAFSLFELLLVIAIIAILAAVAAPRIGSANVGARITAFSARAETEVLFAQQSARDSGVSRSIVIDTDAETMSVYTGSGGATGTLLRSIEFGASPYSVDIDAWTGEDPGFVVVDAYGVFSNAMKIRFFADGVPGVASIDVPSTAARDDADTFGTGGR